MMRWLACTFAVAFPAAAQDAAIRVQPGIEARVRYEGLRALEWGSVEQPDADHVWVRLMPRAEVQAAPIRLLFEGIAAYRLDPGASKGPADESGIDLLQAYGDLHLPVGPVNMELRVGRALMAVGSERLVGTRYGANVPQPFDGVALMATHRVGRIQLLRLRPVAIGPSDFDDRASPRRSLSGVYATIGGAAAGADLYWLSYVNADARFVQGAGRETRNTTGVRLFGTSGGWAWNWEAMLQRGQIGDAQIRAWSVASETSHRHGRMTLRLRANVASGDSDRHDGRLQTFNPLFPKARYFGELSPVGPLNILNIHPGIETDLRGGFTLGLAAFAYWRHRRGDGVYDLPGNVVRDADERAPSHIGNQAEAVLAWQAGRLSLSASYSVFMPGGFIRATGPARTIHMLGLEAQFRR